MIPGLAQNLRLAEHVLADVDSIRETHLSEPGLLVIDVAGLDDATVLAFHAAAQVRGSGVDPRDRDVSRYAGRRGSLTAWLRSGRPWLRPRWRRWGPSLRCGAGLAGDAAWTRRSRHHAATTDEAVGRGAARRPTA
ncbi:DUF6207 family protein [Streptomyces griseorubiginosus]|uniref:DUF6207 family protein n=1 Tax=Streptomyces griseorubiginosus TaxID=67304 RepID=UPI0036E6899E